MPRTATGAPSWPKGFLGSLAHDDEYAVAAIAKTGSVRSLGVDIEPSAPLPNDLVDFVLQPSERQATEGDGLRRRLIFVAKEAVYKAIHPLDGTPLEYQDIEIDLAAWRARIADGRTLALYASERGRLVVVAIG